MKFKKLSPYIFSFALVTLFSASCSKDKKLTTANDQKISNEKDTHGHDEHAEEKDKDAHGHDEHAEEKDKDAHGHDEHAEGKDKDAHGHDKHAEEKEEGHQENPKVGENKGIMKADEVNGFMLSSEALKNFGVSFMQIKNSTILIPESAILKSLEETNIYRRRNQFIKRIDFQTISRNDNFIAIKSNDLAINDEIVIKGVGFVRISELAAYGGAEEGHSH